MNITFLIGNGFDLNLDVKTDYRSFLDYYCSCSSEIEEGKGADPDIVAFKKLISDDVWLWSDLEYTLGQKTVEAPLNTVEGLLKCKRDIDRHLRDFLMKQQDSITLGKTTEFSRTMIRSTDEISTFFPQQMKNTLNEIYAKHISEDRIFHFVSFNYTNIFDRCYANMPDRLSGHSHAGSAYEHRKGKLIHLHGSIHQSMLVGVDNKQQIANKVLAEDSRVQRYMIKPRMNADSQLLRDQTVKDIINSSQIVVVFGMAIGKTDSSWWKTIANNMLKNDSILILVNYQKGLDPSFTYSMVDAREKLVDKFLAVCDLNETEKETLRERTHAYFNTKMFKLPHKIEGNENDTSHVVA